VQRFKIFKLCIAPVQVINIIIDAIVLYIFICKPCKLDCYTLS
jgi:hypothetical protein